MKLACDRNEDEELSSFPNYFYVPAECDLYLTKLFINIITIVKSTWLKCWDKT